MTDLGGLFHGTLLVLGSWTAGWESRHGVCDSSMLGRQPFTGGNGIDTMTSSRLPVRSQRIVLETMCPVPMSKI